MTRARTRGRAAFTLFELLLLIAALLLLLGLLLPAAAKVYQAKARAQSQNNLKQLALACHNYHDAFAFFAPGLDDKGFSVHAHILPFIEQDQIYKLIDFKSAFDDPANSAARKVVIKLFLNPNDPIHSVTMDYGANNYLFCAGARADLKDNDGVFYLNSKLTLQKISAADGSSNTLMVGETLLGDNGMKALDVRRQYVLLKEGALKGLKPDAGVEQWKADKDIAADRGASWMDGHYLQGTFSAGRTVGDERPDVNCGGLGGWAGLRTLSNGVNVALCDGSVRFVSVQVNLTVWQALATWNGGEVIPNF
jgi:prepilin-type processing-associated H-X9-DG protein